MLDILALLCIIGVGVGVLLGCGIAAEVVATSAKIRRRARSRRHPTV
ncbi:hypothetical protein ABN034_10445 [Actinopolymorpha sp. B11F2]